MSESSYGAASTAAQQISINGTGAVCLGHIRAKCIHMISFRPGGGGAIPGIPGGPIPGIGIPLGGIPMGMGIPTGGRP